MPEVKYEKGLAELRAAMGRCRTHFVSVGVFSVFVNLLMLTGPLFMLQVYDRVLASRSEETLVALLVLVTGLFLMLGLLEYARGRVLARAGARFQSLLDVRVFEAVLRRSVAPADRARPNTAARDLEAVRSLLSGPGALRAVRHPVDADLPGGDLHVPPDPRLHRARRRRDPGRR